MQICSRLDSGVAIAVLVVFHILYIHAGNLSCYKLIGTWLAADLFLFSDDIFYVTLACKYKLTQ